MHDEYRHLTESAEQALAEEARALSGEVIDAPATREHPEGGAMCTTCGAIGWHTQRCPASARQVAPRPADYRERILGGLCMIATLGHRCGLVDPQGEYRIGTGPSRFMGPAGPLAGILERLLATDPWLANEPMYRQAVDRVEGRR